MLPRLSVALAVLVFGAGQAAAGDCTGPHMQRERMQEIATDIGAVSYQMTPSTVILRTTFSATDLPPAIEVLFAGGDKRFIEAVKKEAALLRSDCATPVAPVTSIQFGRVSVRNSGLVHAGDPVYEPEPRLKQQLKLTDVLPLVRDLKQQRVRFDFQTMGCPFTLGFAPMRPYLDNQVFELGTPNAERAAFIAWLRGLTLVIPDDMMVTAIGRTSQLAVPCAVLDLT